MSHVVDFEHHSKPFRICITDDGALELYLDHCLRKRREPGEREPRYVWTNVELLWEEHHYVEVRYWPSQQRLTVEVNGSPLLERQFSG